MQEIRFRGKRLDTGEWVYGGALVIPTGEAYIIAGPSHRRREYPIKPETLGQFVTLKDKNGKEIYEGDIVEYKGKIDAMHIGRVQSEVYWIESRCGFHPMISWFSQADDAVEIIGNIYENPELANG